MADYRHYEKTEQKPPFKFFSRVVWVETEGDSINYKGEGYTCGFDYSYNDAFPRWIVLVDLGDKIVSVDISPCKAHRAKCQCKKQHLFDNRRDMALLFQSHFERIYKQAEKYLQVLGEEGVPNV